MNAKIIVCVLILALLTSCDSTELEDRGIVLLIGIEKSEDKIKMYTVFPDNDNVQFYKYAIADNTNEAIQNINLQIRQNIYFGHTHVCILDEEISKDEDMLEDIIDTFEENEEISGRVTILKTSESIEDILSLDLREMTASFISGLYQNDKNIPKKDFTEVARRFYEKENLNIPTLTIKNETVLIS